MEQQVAIGVQGQKFLALVRGAGPQLFRHDVHRGFQILPVLVNGANVIGRFAQRDDVHAPIRVGAIDAPYGGGAADAGNSALAAQDHAKRLIVLDHIFDHALIARLENVQRQSHPGEKNQCQREKRNFPGAHGEYGIVAP